MNVHEILRKLKTLLSYAKEYGFISAMHLLKNKLSISASRMQFVKTDSIDCYRYVTLPEVPVSLDASFTKKNTVNWVIPPFGKGSGGHLNIFRFIANMEKQGIECRVIIVGEPQPMSALQARQEIADWFVPLQASVYLGMNNAPEAYYTIATEWRTAYWVRNFSATCYRCYFVQDFEPCFFAMGSEYVFAEQTYQFGFYGITAGDWLKQKLAAEYGMSTASVGFSYDKHLYKPQINSQGKKSPYQRVFFYARPPTQRRAFELGLLVLQEVARREPNVEVVFAGWDVSGYVIPFRHDNVGLLSLDELPELYASCDVALVLSLSNLSLLPLELMACGTPVVSNKGECAEWLLNTNNARLADVTVEALADAVCAVLADPSEAERLRDGGFATVAETNWYTEAEKLVAILRQIDTASTT